MRANLKAKRMLSKLLCLAMVLGLVPTLALPALAAEEQAAGTDSTYTFRLDAITVADSADGAIKKDSSGVITIQTADSTVTGEVTLNLIYKIGDGAEKAVTDGAYKLTASSFVFNPELPNNASPVTGVVGTEGTETFTVKLSVPRAYTDRPFDVTAKIMDRDGKDTGKTANVGKIEIKAYYPTPINLTGNENAVGTVTDGKFTVTSEKACVVLWSATDTSTTADQVKTSDKTDWKRLSGTAGQGNTYTFDLSGCTNVKAVVVALKGDYSFDGKIDSYDYTPVIAEYQETKSMSQLLRMICDMNSDSKLDSYDYTPIIADYQETKAIEWPDKTVN